MTERRQTDRRQGPPAAGRKAATGAADRRHGDRRRRIARAGVLAALALVSSRAAHRTPLSMDTTAIPLSPAYPEDAEGDYSVPSDEDIDDRAVIDAIIEEAAAHHGVSPDLVRAVVQTESAFNPTAVSPVGAKGLMQLMPGTAREVGIDDPFDPRQNVFGGTKYLSQLIERFNGNVALALAGYNAGPRNVQRYRGIPPFGETRSYVTKIRNILRDTRAAVFPMPATPRRVATTRRAKARTAQVRRAQTARALKATRVSTKVRVPKGKAATKFAKAPTKSRTVAAKAKSSTRARNVVASARKAPAKKAVTKTAARKAPAKTRRAKR